MVFDLFVSIHPLLSIYQLSSDLHKIRINRFDEHTVKVKASQVLIGSNSQIDILRTYDMNLQL